MKDCITTPNRPVSIIPGTPSKSDARLVASKVGVDTGRGAAVDSGDQELARRQIEIRLAVMRLDHWSGDVVSETQIQSEIFPKFPVILEIWTIYRPSFAPCCSFEDLVILTLAGQSEEKARYRRASRSVEVP